jgi:dTDP-glucose pyrophosphorylase
MPLAGRGTRMHAVSPQPKPLIPVADRPMIAWALKGLDNIARTQVIFVALREHEERFGLSQTLHELAPENSSVVLLETVTSGQLATVLAAQHLFDDEEDLLIASSDTYVHSTLQTSIEQRSPDCRGLISVAELPGDRWSFARTDTTGRVVEVAEKRRISQWASTGLYYFSSCSEFLEISQAMVSKHSSQQEMYVMPVYQEYLARGLHISITHAQEVWDMGTPSALATFEQSNTLRAMLSACNSKTQKPSSKTP